MAKKREYFAGANTRNGYTSCFHQIVGNKYKKVYIMKGSAGCGKSTFMKRIGERAQREGADVEYIHCSADSKSLDGVLLPEKEIAVVDGTAPHVMNMKYPSARENIINLGEFWDESKLKAKREELISLTDRKTACYNNIYRALSAAGSVSEIRNSLVKEALLEKKMAAFVARICKKLIKPGAGEESIYLQTVFNHNGFDSLPTFSDAQNVYLIRDKYDIAFHLLEMIRNYAKKIGAERIVSFDPVDFRKPEAVYFPKEDLLFVIEHRYVPGESKKVENKPINTARFINKSAYAEIRQKDRAAFKLYKALLDAAKQYFLEAIQLHESIERIYIRAMDFARLNDYTNKFIGELFKE